MWSGLCLCPHTGINPSGGHLGTRRLLKKINHKFFCYLYNGRYTLRCERPNDIWLYWTINLPWKLTPSLFLDYQWTYTFALLYVRTWKWFIFKFLLDFTLLLIKSGSLLICQGYNRKKFLMFYQTVKLQTVKPILVVLYWLISNSSTW